MNRPTESPVSNRSSGRSTTSLAPSKAPWTSSRSVAAVLTACVGLGVGHAQASPGLDIRGPGAGTFVFGLGVGPSVDPMTQSGQWFRTSSGLEISNSHEFYDNSSASPGGSGIAAQNHLAIKGVFGGYQTSGTNVTGYRLDVSITNTTSSSEGSHDWTSSRNNNQDRFMSQPQSYMGNMRDVRFTAHWADDGDPATNSTSGANTYATSFDSLAWSAGACDGGPAGTGPGDGDDGHHSTGDLHYADAGGSPQSGGAGSDEWSGSSGVDRGPTPVRSWGGYEVPTWNFGDIDIGQTTTRSIEFLFYRPVALTDLPTADSLFGEDLLMARSSDLRIGRYVQSDPLAAGTRDPFTTDYGWLTSNSSVFFSVPTPGAATLLCLGALVASRRRRLT